MDALLERLKLVDYLTMELPIGKNTFIPSFFVVHAAFLMGIPYLIMRRGVARMKYELERDFYYMTRRQINRTS